MNFSKRKQRVIKIVQHILAAVIAVVVVTSVSGTGIMLPGVNGEYSYNLYESDRTRNFEDSYLFNNILGNNISDILRFVAVRSQLEDGGEYTGEKTIDVTAYVNRGTSLSGDYITAVYKLSDLLKWAQSGFTYEKKQMSENESYDFLSSYTTYTHLKNNQFSGGMNAYLNSQLQDNSMKFPISGNTTPEGGSHNCLVNRYQTIDGKNIEDIVSTWSEYNALCSTVEEAARDLLSNYEEYGKAKEFFSYDNSNLRYYITRSINGNIEVYTNIDSLSKGAAGIELDDMFEGFGRYVYYCPYELKYETNSLIKESVIRNILHSYSYAYPDQCRIYIGVETSDYSANDAFALGKKDFGKYMPYRTQLMIAGCIAAFLYILLAVIYIRGLRPAEIINPENESPIGMGEKRAALAAKKRIPTEALILIGLLIMALPFGTIPILKLMKYSINTFTRSGLFNVFCAVGAFIVDIGLLFIIYGIAVKAKSRTVWKDTLIRKAVFASRDFIVNTTDNGNVIIRTWIPYVIFVVINFLLIKTGIPGIILAVCFDIMVGIYIYRQNLDRIGIIKVIEKIRNGDVKAKVDVRDLHSDNISLAEAVNSIGEGIDAAVNTSMKDEKLKADLITNVSHDIKTPLTSIINYVDLIKRENIDNQKVNDYIRVLDEKSQKLKQLTEDLVEASKISSGNISIQYSKINFVELVNQTLGEFYEKLESNKLTPIFKPQEPAMFIMADARHLWRVIENLLNNVCKYALTGTRVYLDMRYLENEGEKRKVEFSIKNISASELNVDAGELTERFIRGDESRTTEGSGLGLSIAMNLTKAQNGTFDIRLDGDLFKVIIAFEVAQ